MDPNSTGALHLGPSHSLHYVSLYLAIQLYPLSFNKLIKVSVFLSSVRHSSKSTEPGEGSWESPICTHLREKLWVTWGPSTYD